MDGASALLTAVFTVPSEAGPQTVWGRSGTVLCPGEAYLLPHRDRPMVGSQDPFAHRWGLGPKEETVGGEVVGVSGGGPHPSRQQCALKAEEDRCV